MGDPSISTSGLRASTPRDAELLRPVCMKANLAEETLPRRAKFRTSNVCRRWQPVRSSSASFPSSVSILWLKEFRLVDRTAGGRDCCHGADLLASRFRNSHGKARTHSAAIVQVPTGERR